MGIKYQWINLLLEKKNIQIINNSFTTNLYINGNKYVS